MLLNKIVSYDRDYFHALLDFNKGQLAGLPKNPRFFRDYRYEAMKKSISDCPEMLELRELIVYPYMVRYIVV